MQITPRIYMSGSCREAINLYKDVFGASVDYMMTFGDAKMGTAEQKDLIINSQIDISGNKFHLADNMGTEIASGNQVSFTVIMSNPDEVKAAFEKITEGGKVIMEPAPSFFSPCHCGLTDKFGITWQINCTK
jgi:PhnB protein